MRQDELISVIKYNVNKYDLGHMFTPEVKKGAYGIVVINSDWIRVYVDGLSRVIGWQLTSVNLTPTIRTCDNDSLLHYELNSFFKGLHFLLSGVEDYSSIPQSIAGRVADMSNEKEVENEQQ